MVVEGGEGLGALITAEAALHLLKEVMAVLGSVFSALSVGTHGLLRDGARARSECPDVLTVLGQGGQVLDDRLRAPDRLGFALRPEREGSSATCQTCWP